MVQRISQDGIVAAHYEYDAFGNQLPRESAGIQATDGLETDPNPLRYCGEYWDSDLGEIYLRARSYNPAAGRFTSADAVKAVSHEINGQSMIDPLSLNLYAYAINDPIQYCDSSGYFAITAAILGFIAFSSILGAISGAGEAAMAGGDGEDILAGAIGGWTVGLIMGFAGAGGLGVGAMMGLNAILNGFNSVAQQMTNTQNLDAYEIDIIDVGSAAFIGALTGGTGHSVGRVADALAKGDSLVKALMQIMHFSAEEPLKYVATSTLDIYTDSSIISVPRQTVPIFSPYPGSNIETSAYPAAVYASAPAYRGSTTGTGAYPASTYAPTPSYSPALSYTPVPTYQGSNTGTNTYNISNSLNQVKRGVNLIMTALNQFMNANKGKGGKFSGGGGFHGASGGGGGGGGR